MGANTMTTPPQLKPKPCPFCGSEARCYKNIVGGSLYTNWYAGCSDDNCGTDPVASGGSEAEALAAWNTRHEPPDVQTLRETVAKLPKIWRLDESGELVQDVPVLDGMDVYLPVQNGILKWHADLHCITSEHGRTKPFMFEGYASTEAAADKLQERKAAAQAAVEKGNSDEH